MLNGWIGVLIQEFGINIYRFSFFLGGWFMYLFREGGGGSLQKDRRLEDGSC